MSNIGLLVLGGLALILLSRGVPQVGAIRPKTNQNVVGGSISRSKLTEAPDATMSSGITRGEIRGIISPPPEVQVKAAVEKINAFVETPVNKVIPQAVSPADKRLAQQSQEQKTLLEKIRMRILKTVS